MSRKRTPWPVGQTEIWHSLAPSDREPFPSKQLADIYVARGFSLFDI